MKKLLTLLMLLCMLCTGAWADYYEDKSQGSGIYGELTTDDIASMVTANEGTLKIVCRTVSNSSKDYWLGKTKVQATDYGQVDEGHVLVLESVADNSYRIKTLSGEYFKGTSGTCSFTTNASEAATMTLRTRGHSSDTGGVGADTAPYNNGKYNLVAFVNGSNFLNCNNTNLTPQWTSGVGGYSCYCVYAVTEVQRVEISPTFISTSDTRTANREYASKLVDGDTGTKWGMGFTSGTSTEWIVVQANNTILKGYKLFNGDDTNSQQERRWKNWKVEGSNTNNGTDWQEIQTKTNVAMDPTNYGENSYSCNDNTTPYNYYRVTVNDNKGGDMIQMSEMNFVVQYAEAERVNVTFNVRDNNNNIVYTTTTEVDANTTWDAPAAPDFVTYTTSTFQIGNVVNQTCETTYTSTFPAAFSTTANPIWYKWKMRYDQNNSKRGYLYFDAANTGGYVRETENTAKGGGAYYWALIGNEWGFKVINYAQGTGRYLVVGDDITFNKNNGTELVPTKGTAETPDISNVYFKIKGTSKYLYDVMGTKLGTWDDNAASSDVGSQIALEEVGELSSFFDPNKVYTLKSNNNTYFKYAASGSTAASYRETPSYFKITQTNTGYQFTDIFGKKLNLSTWNVTTGGDISWVVSPVDEETGTFYIAQHGEGSGGHYLGHRDNQNVGTGIYTDQPNPLLWTIEEADSYKYEYNVKVLAANGAIIYNGTETTNGNTLVSDRILTTSDLTEKVVDGHVSSVAVNADVITVTYNKIGSYFTMDNKTITLGAKTQTITPDTQWYVLSQIRGGETPAFDNGSAVRREAAANTVTALFTEGVSATDRAKYLVRFLSTNVEGVYQIQFATGRYWNGVSTNATATNAKFYHVHLATQTTSGQDQNGIAIINTTDLVSFGSRVDNDGAGNGFSYWGSGDYNSGTNNVCYIYPIEFTVSEEALADLQAKVDAASTPILAKKVGYPYIGCNEVTNLMEYRNVGLGSPITNANYDAAYNALYEVYNVSNINLPEDGKAYFLTNVAADDAKTKHILYESASEKKLKWAPITDIIYTNKQHKGLYICRKTDDRFVFVNAATGNFLIWRGSDAGENSNKGLREVYAEDCRLTVKQAVYSGTYQGKAANQKDFFGYVCIGGKRGANNSVCFLYSTGGTDNFNQDTSNDVHRYGDGHSAMFAIEEVTDYAVNKTTLKTPKVDDGKTYASIYLPYAVELPAGVTAYKVTETSDASFHLEEISEDGNLPKETGAILVGEDTNMKTLVPCAATPTAQEDNMLSGCKKATPVSELGSGTVYVLNGGQDSGIGFFPLSSSASLSAYKAYYREENTPVQGFRFNFDEAIVTAIQNISATGSQKSEVYDLQGRRMLHVQKGLNIVNGRKVIR